MTEEEDAPEGTGGPPFPPFAMLVLGLAAQAHVGLGLHPDPVTKATKVDLPMARQAIDLLGALEEKTKGNLDAEEAALLTNALADLRMAYVRVATTKPSLS